MPKSGPGTYQAAKESVRSRSSSGALIRYDLRVEDGLSIDPDKAAVLIQEVLDDPRSWRGTRRWRFDLTPVGQSATLHAYIVTPKTTDRLCAPYLTRGEVSCHHGNRVVLNARRWLLGADSYGSDLTNYRRYLVNHEFGHALGKHHEDARARKAGAGDDAADQRARLVPQEPMAAIQPRGLRRAVERAIAL